MSLPAPKPSRRPRNTLNGMDDYYDSIRPCFDGECQVLMADGSKQLMKVLILLII